MPEAADPRVNVAPGRVLVDVTTLVQSVGPAHGITRLLGKLLQELALRVPKLILCAYDQRRRRFRLLRTEPASFASMLSATDATENLQIGRPEAFLTPLYDGRRTVASRMYFALSVEKRAAARSSFLHAAIAANGIGKLIRAPRRAPMSKIAFADNIVFLSSDLLLQWGALWGCHGIVDELRRVAITARVVSLIYDFLPILRPEFFDQRMAARFLSWSLATLEASRHIVVISRTTQNDLSQVASQFQTVCPPTSVLRLGDDALAVPPQTIDPQIAAIADRPFVLCLGTMEIRKNHRLLYQVWRSLAQDEVTPRLLIVGQRGWLTDETEALFLHDRTLHEHVVIIRGAGDATAAWLLSRALFTVYPSFYEGWGLPVAESLYSGRIVVASDCQAAHEAGQGLAFHLPCDDVPRWTDLIRTLFQDSAQRARLEADIAQRMVRQLWTQTGIDLAETIRALQNTAA